VFFLLATGLYLAMIEMLSGDPQNFWKNLQYRHGPTLLAVLVLSPIMLRDMCKLSNRFAGPIVRLRRGLNDLAAGKRVATMKFRDRDFWQDLANEFNQVAERLRDAESRAALQQNAPGAVPPVASPNTPSNTGDSRSPAEELAAR
jgi:signal transduction histidine kinase